MLSARLRRQRGLGNLFLTRIAPGLDEVATASEHLPVPDVPSLTAEARRAVSDAERTGRPLKQAMDIQFGSRGAGPCLLRDDFVGLLTRDGVRVTQPYCRPAGDDNGGDDTWHVTFRAPHPSDIEAAGGPAVLESVLAGIERQLDSCQRTGTGTGAIWSDASKDVPTVMP